MSDIPALAFSAQPPILVVDNDPNMRTMLKTQLFLDGYQTIFATGTGLELLAAARRLVQHNHLPIAVVDMRLIDDSRSGDVSGLDLIRELRREYGTLSIIVTSYGDLQTAQQALRDCGAFGFVAKVGVARGELAAQIARALTLTCLCEHSGRPHWHPLAARSASLVVTEQPEGAVSLVQHLATGNGTTLGKLLAERMPLIARRNTAIPAKLLTNGLVTHYLGERTLSAPERPNELLLDEHFSIVLPDPIAWLAQAAERTVLLVAETELCSGLSWHQILIDAHGALWVPHLEHAGERHRFADLATLVVDVLSRYGLPAHASSRLFYELALSILAHQPGTSMRRTRMVRQDAEACRTAAIIEGLLAPVLTTIPYAEQLHELHWALLLRCLQDHQTMAEVDPIAAQRQRWLAGMLCIRLDDPPDTNWFPSAWRQPLWEDSPEYRSTELAALAETLRRGESCAVIGFVGLNRVPLLQRFGEDVLVQQAYLGRAYQRIVIGYIDWSWLTQPDSYQIYEQLLTALVGAVQRRLMASDIRSELLDLQRSVFASHSALLAQRSFEHAVSLLCHGLQLALGLVLDNFVVLLQRLPERERASTIHGLRTLARRYDGQISYLVGLPDRLERVLPNDFRSSFADIFGAPHWLMPDTRADTLLFIHDMARRFGHQLAAGVDEQLLDLTGGHASVIQALLADWHMREKNPEQHVLQWALQLPRVDREYTQIWEMLSAKECQALSSWSLQANIPTDSQVIGLLRNKQLLRGPESDTAQIFSPLFARWVKGQRPYIVREKQTFFLKTDQLKLNGQALKVFKLLYEADGQECSREKLLSTWSNAEVDDNSIHQIISVLRKEIGRLGFQGMDYITSGQSPTSYRLIGTDRYRSFE